MGSGKPGRRSVDQIADEIAHLRDLDASALRLRWREVAGKAAAPGLRGELLVRALAYAIQEKTYGGVSLSTAKRLQTIAREGKVAATAARDGKPSPPRRLMPGTRLVREWQGVVHDVIVIPDGFLWQGATYPSLSAVAKAITGTTWNGWVFFGAKPAPKKPKLPNTGSMTSTAVDANARQAPGSDVHA